MVRGVIHVKINHINLVAIVRYIVPNNGHLNIFAMEGFLEKSVYIPIIFMTARARIDLYGSISFKQSTDPTLCIQKLGQAFFISSFLLKSAILTLNSPLRQTKPL